MKESVNKQDSNILPEYYDSIDLLPIMNWNKIHETGDMTHLLVKKEKMNDEQIKLLLEVWRKLYDEYIDRFGFSESFQDMLTEKIKIGKLKLKKIITGDESISNFIRVHEIKLEALKSKAMAGSSDIYKAKQAIESSVKYRGIRISLTETSVREFYSYLQDIKKK